MVKFLFSIQLKALHHFRGKVIIIVGVNFRRDLQQLAYRKIKMLCEVFNVTDACIQSRRRDCLTVHLDGSGCNVLISGD